MVVLLYKCVGYYTVLAMKRFPIRFANVEAKTTEKLGLGRVGNE